jgi:hypothetical protein
MLEIFNVGSNWQAASLDFSVIATVLWQLFAEIRQSKLLAIMGLCSGKRAATDFATFIILL